MRNVSKILFTKRVKGGGKERQSEDLEAIPLQEPPVLTVSPQKNIQFKVGEEARLSCLATGKYHSFILNYLAKDLYFEFFSMPICCPVYLTILSLCSSALIICNT